MHCLRLHFAMLGFTLLLLAGVSGCAHSRDVVYPEGYGPSKQALTGPADHVATPVVNKPEPRPGRRPLLNVID